RRRSVTEPAYPPFEGTLLTVCPIERDQPLLDLRFATPQLPYPKPKPDHERSIDGDLPSDPAELAWPEQGEQPFPHLRRAPGLAVRPRFLRLFLRSRFGVSGSLSRHLMRDHQPLSTLPRGEKVFLQMLALTLLQRAERIIGDQLVFDQRQAF